MKITELEPKQLWTNFANLNAVPRPSKKEEKVIAFMVAFGKSLGLDTYQDETGNVIIKKPATAGMENRKTVVLQSHLDMVHQKNNDTVFDFSTEGIKMLVDGDWVRADGTTLGADNGIGVASIMAILQSKDIPHPALEALFTIDEETGMTGAKGLKGGLLSGAYLLNLDTEEDDEIDIGCAGGVDVSAFREYDVVDTPINSVAYTLTLKGLHGGHSGMDIHKGYANANKLMNRLLFTFTEKFGLRIASVDGGGLRNAIPRESIAVVTIDKNDEEAFKKEVVTLTQTLQHEYSVTEPTLTILLKPTVLPEKVMEQEEQEDVLRALYVAFNGVYKMSQTIADLVETSNNVARVIIKEGEINVYCLTRSASESSKYDLADTIRSAFELAGFEVEYTGSYPGWEPKVDAEILKIVKAQYETLFRETPNVVACHAGLECGILGTNYPEMEMVSFGPTIKGAHSPAERVNIASVQKFWKFLLAILQNIPTK
ncbi:aminoacyl-histidine dipeptidase [Capnocytophaga sp.]